MRRWRWWRWGGLTVIGVLAAVFASFNSGERVALDLGVAVFYQVSLVPLIFAAFLVGMATMFLLGLRHDLRVRKALREAGFGEPIAPSEISASARWSAPAPGDDRAAAWTTGEKDTPASDRGAPAQNRARGGPQQAPEWAPLSGHEADEGSAAPEAHVAPADVSPTAEAEASPTAEGSKDSAELTEPIRAPRDSGDPPPDSEPQPRLPP